MDKNLLQKEEEFNKSNAELELKTKELLKEVEGLVKYQERLSKNENFTCRNDQLPARSSVYIPHHERHEDEILPEASYGMGAENIIRVLRSKIKGLQNEMEAMEVGRNKQTEACRKLEVKVKALEEDLNKWQQQAGMLRDSLKKEEILHCNTVAKLTQQECENSSLKKELESVKKELRTTMQSYKANEVRLNRSLEELKKLRTIMHNYERDDKELRDVTRRKSDEVAAVVKRLEKQKSELLLGFKKQMQLIDNLKKQKVHLQAASMMQFSKEELLKLLDLNPSNMQQSEDHT